MPDTLATLQPTPDQVHVLGALLPDVPDDKLTDIIYRVLNDPAFRSDLGGTASMGSNSGTVDLAMVLDPDLLRRSITEQYADIPARSDALVAAALRFDEATPDGIKDDETEGRAADFRKQLLTHIKKVDDVRETVKAPVLAAQRTIDALFKKAWIEPVDMARKSVSDKLEARLKAKVEAERKRKAEEAAKAAAEAERLARAAAATGSAKAVEAALDADQRAQDVAAAASAAKPADLARARGEFGATASLKQVLKVRVTDWALVPSHLRLLDEPLAIRTLSGARGRDGTINQIIPGIEGYYEEKLA